MIYRPAKSSDEEALSRLIGNFHEEIARLKGSWDLFSRDEAKKELKDELSQERFIVYVAEDETLCGYAVFKDEDRTVWIEQLYVEPAFRRQGIARQFLAVGEALAETRGQETLYFWVHPDNTAMLLFLKANGYDVLNLIEVRRRRERETCTDEVDIFGTTLRYKKGMEDKEAES